MKLILEAPEIVFATREGNNVRLAWRNKENPANYNEIDVWCNGSLAAIVGKTDTEALLTGPLRDEPNQVFISGAEYKFQVLAYDPSESARAEAAKYSNDTLQDGVSTELPFTF